MYKGYSFLANSSDRQSNSFSLVTFAGPETLVLCFSISSSQGRALKRLKRHGFGITSNEIAFSVTLNLKEIVFLTVSQLRQRTELKILPSNVCEMMLS